MRVLSRYDCLFLALRGRSFLGRGFRACRVLEPIGFYYAGSFKIRLPFFCLKRAFFFGPRVQGL